MLGPPPFASWRTGVRDAVADLVNDARSLPTLDSVLGVARRKSGNYTVRRPLEIGAVLAGCPQGVVRRLGDFGTAVGLDTAPIDDSVRGVLGGMARLCAGRPG